jgi:dTMP kinase
MPRGPFIVFSGGEGSGKTSILKLLKEEFPAIVTTREPGGTPFGEALRGPLLDPSFTPNPWAELFLFMSIRAQHVTELIHPSLEDGRAVVSDRYLEDSYAYQWAGKLGQTDPTQLMTLAQQAGFPMPDLWLWFDVEPALGLRRRRGTNETNRLDNESLAFHDHVRENFARLMTIEPYARIGRRIDSNGSLDGVYTNVKAELKPYLK